MMLLRARKEVLIKAVIQAIPTYTMGVFQLLVKLCEELNALCAKFGGDKWEMKEKYIARVWGV